jgi:lipopolysaccharide export system protein LptA
MGMIRLAKMKQWAAGAFACGLIAAGPAAAQLQKGSGAPLDISADQLEVVNAQCLATYSGGAEALQDVSRMRAEVLKIYYQPNASAKPGGTGKAGAACGNQLDRIEAKGSVYYVTPQQRVRGDAAVYDAAADTITITGDVVAAQAQNVLRGSKMVIKVSTGDTQVISDVKGRNKPGRVRTVIYPKQQAGQPAARR